MLGSVGDGAPRLPRIGSCGQGQRQAQAPQQKHAEQRTEVGNLLAARHAGEDSAGQGPCLAVSAAGDFKPRGVGAGLQECLPRGRSKPGLCKLGPRKKEGRTSDRHGVGRLQRTQDGSRQVGQLAGTPKRRRGKGHGTAQAEAALMEGNCARPQGHASQTDCALVTFGFGLPKTFMVVGQPAAFTGIKRGVKDPCVYHCSRAARVATRGQDVQKQLDGERTGCSICFFPSFFPESIAKGSSVRSPWTSYTEPSCTEPSCREPSYIEPGYIEPSYIEPSYIEPSYIEPSYIEPSYIEPSYTEPSYIEPSYIEPSYIEPSYTEPSYIEPSYIEPSYIEQVAQSQVT